MAKMATKKASTYVFNEVGDLTVSPISFAKFNGMIYMAYFNGKKWKVFHYFEKDGIPERVVFEDLKI